MLQQLAASLAGQGDLLAAEQRLAEAMGKFDRAIEVLHRIDEAANQSESASLQAASRAGRPGTCGARWRSGKC